MNKLVMRCLRHLAIKYIPWCTMVTLCYHSELPWCTTVFHYITVVQHGSTMVYDWFLTMVFHLVQSGKIHLPWWEWYHVELPWWTCVFHYNTMVHHETARWFHGAPRCIEISLSHLSHFDTGRWNISTVRPACRKSRQKGHRLHLPHRVNHLFGTFYTVENNIYQGVNDGI